MRALNALAATVLLSTAGFIAAAPVRAVPISYKLDPAHTMVLFSWNHFGFSHPTAELGLGDGTLIFDEQHPAKSSVEVSLPLADLDTHVPALDKHLKKADFFDADKYPMVTFKSTMVQPLGGHKFKITGQLTVHGVTESVVLDATLNKVGTHPLTKAQSIGFDAVGTLKRSDFGVAAYVPNVSDQITVRITTEGSVPKADGSN